MSLQWCCYYNIYKISLSSIMATLLATCPYSSNATIWISSLLWWEYSYLTSVSVSLLKLLLRVIYWNSEHFLYVTNFIQLVSPQQVDWFFHKPSCTGKHQMKVICTYVECTKVTTNNWDIRLSVTEKSLFANISWMTRQIHIIKLALESAHQTISNDIWYIS